MKKRIVSGVLGTLMLLGLVPAAFAQGCALCRTMAEAQGTEGAKALNLAILILLVPTVLIFVGILLWAFRFRNQSWAEQSQTDDRASLVASLPWPKPAHLRTAAQHPSARGFPSAT